MKIEQLTEELKKRLPGDTFENNKHDYWIFWSSLTGFIKSDYFHILIKKDKTGKEEIEILHTTDKPLHIVKIIKEIDSAALVISYENTLRRILH